MKHRIGIFESLCAGYSGNIDAPLPANFLQEGYTMVQAIQRWLAQTTKFDSVAFLHASIVAKLSTSHSVASLTSNAKDKLLLEACDLVTRLDLDKLIVIAPECDGELATIVDAFQNHGVETWNCGVDFIKLASDKWLLSQELARLQIPHPETLLLTQFMVDQRDFTQWNKLVIKPRDGAGCMDLFRFSNIEAAREYVQQHQVHFHCHDKWIVQPWIDGCHASRSIIVAKGDVLWFPWMTQEFETEESPAHRFVTLSYRGANEIHPSTTPQSCDAIVSMVEKYRSELHGWIGFDFVIPDANLGDGSPVLIEINPRFTTSFACIDLNSVKTTETLLEG